MNITVQVLDHQGQMQAYLAYLTSGVWSISLVDTNIDTFIVTFNDPSFQSVLASMRPWDHPEWSAPSRINILLELLYWACVFNLIFA